MGPRQIRTALIAGGIALVIGVLIVVFVTMGGGSNDTNVAERDPDAVQTPVSSTRTTAVPVPSGGSVDETVAPAPSAKTYDGRKAKNVEIPGEMEVRLISVEENKDPKAIGPGALDRPVMVVSLELSNKQSDAVDLSGVTVSLLYDDDQVGTPVQSELGQPFRGQLEAGKNASGVYVFSVPKNIDDSVTILVQYSAGKGIAKFRT